MTVKVFILGTLATMLMSWGILALIITWVDPLSSTASLAFILFFLAMFLAVASLTSLLGYVVRSIFFRSQLSAYRVRPALRQGVFLGVFTDLLLFLQLERILIWWVSAIIVLLFIVVELVFISYDKYAATNRGTGEASAS
ncbi:MAG TPA: hypothetical protein VJI96_03805 [Candidatus Andersenbacteria bacterium]|nr:hypothetical protein [Candidatus Andersenbacteria bacterium]